MTRRFLLLLLVLVAPPASAWEAQSTHAGLTEQAALASRTQERLVAFGRKNGWFDGVAVPRDKAGALYQKLAILEPSTGAVPDARGRQSVLAWLVAGAILEDVPASRGRNHFYDPAGKKGLPDGVAAPDWLSAKDNELGLPRFWRELEWSITAAKPEERDVHLALAMLCAGASLHVLQDVGSPSRVRNDLQAHDLPLGAGPADRGSRFERLAAVTYGQLGVPAAGAPELRARARDFFTSADGKGLADVTAARWYSAGTLPRDLVMPLHPAPGEVLAAAIKGQPLPAPRPKDLQLRAAASDEGAVLRDAQGVCLAAYRVDGRKLAFSIPDECAAEQIASILPRVGAYGAGFVAWMFRGTLTVDAAGGTVTVSVPEGQKLGAGKLYVLAEDATGQRWSLGNADSAGGSFKLDKAAKRVVAVFHGVDGEGEELVAAGVKDL